MAQLFVLGACDRSKSEREHAMKLSGNIEVVDAQLGFKIAGRVAQRFVSEGERVTAGQPIARLDSVEQEQQLQLRKAELAAAQASLAELEAGSRPQEIAASEATLRSIEADRDRLKLDFTRSEELRNKDVISARDFEAAQAQLRVADARVHEAEERYKLVKAGPRIEEIEQARARVQQATAAVAYAQTQVENTQLVSPLTGVVLSHNIEAGEFVSPGTPVVTVADLAHPWVRAYIEQTELGRWKHGQKVKVTTDSYPNKTYEGTIGFIASDAEFTPKTVQTTKERAKLVFRIKVDVANVNDELKPGMPADVDGTQP
ncbi:MAG TPA: efflux RND transporter periplasmic adaptor subunit [Opitutaceae bacterium]|nr:efflux RND transporter periplasmic adaptor subunit [Opitutaceae bacterium]